MKELIERLEKQGYLDFLEYFNDQESIEEALISFFCLLELIKARLVIAVQETLFHPIKVWPTQGAQP
jgi:segregation and condensation protein A